MTLVNPERIATAIIELAEARGSDKTICPSEVARYLGGPHETVWRPLMGPIREQVIRLEGEGKITVKQAGVRVDPTGLRGIYRIAIADELS